MSPQEALWDAVVEAVAAKLRADPRLLAVGDDDIIRGLTNIGRYLKCSHVTVGRLIREEGLPARQVGSEWRASRRALSTWCAGPASTWGEGPGPAQ